MWNPKSIRNVLALSKSEVFNSADVMAFLLGKAGHKMIQTYMFLGWKKSRQNDIL